MFGGNIGSSASRILNANAARQYHPIQLERVHNFLYNVLHDLEQVFDHRIL